MRAAALFALVAACGSRPRPRDTGPAPVDAPPATAPSTCRGPLVFAPPHPDSFIDQALAGPAAAMPWPMRPMQGPVASRAAAAPGCTTVERPVAVAPLLDVERCTTADPTRPLGPDNIATHLLVIATARGWWSYPLAREWWPHGDADDEPRVAHVEALVLADRFGDGGLELSTTAIEGPPGGAQRRRAVVCAVGVDGTPACFDQVFTSGGPFHGAGALAYRVALGCDGTVELAGWEGGDRVGLVHARGALVVP